jgi:hypothetical protein
MREDGFFPLRRPMQIRWVGEAAQIRITQPLLRPWESRRRLDRHA